MLVRSAVTSAMPSTRRRRLPLFLRRKWFPVALRCRTLPVRVMRNRLAVARCVFCLGILLVLWSFLLARSSGRSLCGYVSCGASAGAATTSGGAGSGSGSAAACATTGSGSPAAWATTGSAWSRAGSWARCSSARGLLRRRQDHHHVPSVLLGMGLDDGLIREVRDQPVQDLAAELGAGHLAPPEHDGHLDPRARPQEPLDVALLRGVVVRIDLRTELDLLDLDPGLLLAGLLLTDVALVLELPVVHDPAPREVRLRRHLHEIEIRDPVPDGARPGSKRSRSATRLHPPGALAPSGCGRLCADQPRPRITSYR